MQLIWLCRISSNISKLQVIRSSPMTSNTLLQLKSKPSNNKFSPINRSQQLELLVFRPHQPLFKVQIREPSLDPIQFNKRLKIQPIQALLSRTRTCQPKTSGEQELQQEQEEDQESAVRPKSITPSTISTPHSASCSLPILWMLRIRLIRSRRSI